MMSPSGLWLLVAAATMSSPALCNARCGVTDAQEWRVNAQLGSAHGDDGTRRVTRRHFRRLARDEIQPPALQEDGFEPLLLPLRITVYHDNGKGDAGKFAEDHSLLGEQIHLLNKDFAAANITFKPETIVDHDRAAYAAAANLSVYRDMEDENSVASSGLVHVFIVDSIPLEHEGDEPTVGTASYPWSIYEDRGGLRNGIVVRASSVMGGRSRNFGLGKTLSHEMGHWLGLLHTFGETCDDDVNDHVADTAVSLRSVLGECSGARVSCPGKAERDPVQNIMDYNTDQCTKSFTPGQVGRMRRMYERYRAKEFNMPDYGGDEARQACYSALCLPFEMCRVAAGWKMRTGPDPVLYCDLETDYGAAPMYILDGEVHSWGELMKEVLAGDR